MAQWAWEEESIGGDAYGEVRLYQFFCHDGRLYGPADPMMAFSSRGAAEALATSEGAATIEEWTIVDSVASERTATARVLDRIEAATGQGKR